jgi:uncharacterized damage-inducible protein DinB
MFDSLHRLHAHMAWADEQILSALDAADPRQDETVGLFGHLVAAESIWLSRIRSRDAGTLAPWTRLSLHEATELAAANAVGYADLLGTAPDLATLVAYRTSRGEPMENPLGDILLHVALHGSYHRGQIATRLRGLDLAAPPTDFIVFSRLFPPGQGTSPAL